MASGLVADNYRWLATGKETFPAMLQAIDHAQRSISLEMYIFSPGNPGVVFQEALAHARRRGVAVRVLVDGLGSNHLPADFWKPLLAAGGEVRVFNPVALNRLGIRNHRKLIVCDERLAFVGGYNVAPEYDGDGVTNGWCDLGMRLEGRLRENEYFKGRWWDTLVYAILDYEWQAQETHGEKRSRNRSDDI